MDALCEKYYNIRPYAYCKNNSIKFIDLWGILKMNNMKRLFWIFLFTLNFTDITAQSFYDMLRETMDSTYVYIINRSSKYNDKERFKYNNIYQPWGYNPSDKLKAIKPKNKKYN